MERGWHFLRRGKAILSVIRRKIDQSAGVNMSGRQEKGVECWLIEWMDKVTDKGDEES